METLRHERGGVYIYLGSHVRRNRERQIDTGMERAAYEIKRVYFALTLRSFTQTTSFEKVDFSEPKLVPE